MTVGMTVELQTSSFCMKPRVNKDESKKKEDESKKKEDESCPDCFCEDCDKDCLAKEFGIVNKQTELPKKGL